MKIVSFWERVANPIDNGEKDFAPSVTQPDITYSVRQLVEEYSIDALPPMALLQPLFDEDGVDEDYMAALRGADRADRSMLALQNTKLRDSIIEKVKKMHEFRKEREEWLAKNKVVETAPPVEEPPVEEPPVD